MHQALSEIDLVPSQADQFRYPQAVTIGDENQSRVAKTVAPLRTRGGDDLANLFFRQIFPVAILGIRLANGNFPFYDGWSGCGGVFAMPVFLAWAIRSFSI
jgi:hypothetical protein